MTYQLTEEERLLINSGLPVDLEGKQNIEPLSINQVNIVSKGTSADGCWEYETVEVNCSCHSDEDHENAACGHPGTATVAHYIPRCGNTGGGGIGGGNNGPVTGPAGPSTPDDGQPVVTTPVSPDGSNIVANNLVLNLSITSALQIKWLNRAENTDIVNELTIYLIQNVYSDESKEFAISLIEAKISNDFSAFFTLNIFTQNPYNIWKEISQAERDLIKENPHEAYAVFKNREIATAATVQKFGGNGLNDKSDAFRHAYYNVINSKRVGIDYAKLFSDAHESEVPSPLLKEKQMDLFNNNIGHQSINGNGNLSYSELADLIYQKLLNGDLRYLSPLNGIASPPYDANNDDIQDCSNCANGIIATTVLTPTN